MNQNSELDGSDVDADILSITNYFGGELSPPEAADVEARVVDDDEFFAKVGILIKVQLLESPVVYRGMRVALDERAARIREDLLAIRVMRSAWPDIDERLAEPPPPVVAVANRSDTPVTTNRPTLHTGDDGRKWWARYTDVPLRIALYFGNRIALAAVLVSVVVAVPLYLKVEAIAAALEGKPSPSGMSTWPLATKVVTVASNASPQVVGLPRGVRATVMPGSRISFDTAGILFGSSMLVRLDGEASFEVPAQPNPLRLVTRAADISVMSGDFAVRSADSGSETLITMVRGQARVRRLGGPADEVLEVTSGFVRVARTQTPAIVTQGTDTFPRIPPQ